MKLAIVGSRTFDNYELLVQFIKDNYDLTAITHIISGGAKGADSLGERFAKENDIETIIFKAEWEQYGNSAGIIRNIDIISNCDNCVAFWDGKSLGTMHAIELCEKYNKECKICHF